MKRMPFEPQKYYYDDRIQAIDEQICDLIKQRKELSNNNPGFPNKQLISAWGEKYNLYEAFLNNLFTHFLNEDIYKPVVEPREFLKNVPILKLSKKDNLFYLVTFIRQYENASIVHLLVYGEDSDEISAVFQEHTFFELSIKGDVAEYDCRNEGGEGSRGYMSYTFIVSPPLPDDISENKLIFKEYKDPFKRKPTGFEFVI